MFPRRAFTCIVALSFARCCTAARLSLATHLEGELSEATNSSSNAKQYLVSGSSIENVNGYYEGNSLDQSFYKAEERGRKCLLWWDASKYHWEIVLDGVLLAQTVVMFNPTTPLDLEWYDAKLVKQRDMKIEDVTGQERASEHKSTFQIKGSSDPKIDGFYDGETYNLLYVKMPDSFAEEVQLAQLQAQKPWLVKERRSPGQKTREDTPSYLWYNEDEGRWVISSDSVMLAQSNPIERRRALPELMQLGWEIEGNEGPSSALAIVKSPMDAWVLKASDKYCGAREKKSLISGESEVSTRTCQQYALRDPACGFEMFSNGKRTCKCVLRGHACGKKYNSKGSNIYTNSVVADEQGVTDKPKKQGKKHRPAWNDGPLKGLAW